MERQSLKKQLNPVWTVCKSFVEKWWFWILFVLVLVLIAGLLIYGGYWAPWTGFGGHSSIAGQWQPAKTLWDWMDLFLVPAVLAGGAAIFTWGTTKKQQEVEERRAEAKRREEERRVETERKAELDRTREAALQAYLDRMTELIRDGLGTSEPGDPKRSVARARTLTVLRKLDEERKGLLLLFLYEANLIGALVQDKPVEAIVDLQKADLTNANLVDAYLVGVDLSGAYLVDAWALRANLYGANLRDAQLAGADLHWADLRKADLRGAFLAGTNMSCADLRDAKVVGEELARAAFLEVAVLPDGVSLTDLQQVTSPLARTPQGGEENRQQIT
jgi:uncharacterized protein YjbI with pentapeptide repeats